MPANVVRKKRPWFFISVLVFCVILIVLSYIPLPYYIYSPGNAERLQPLIQVSGGHKTEKGTFMLTTVYVVYAKNVYDLLYGLSLPDHQLLPVSQVDPGLTDQQYNQIEDYMMTSSHESAEIAALQYLKKPVQVHALGVQVIYVNPTSKAIGLLQSGDIITSINGQSLQNPARLMQVLQHATIGDKVALTILRGGRKIHLVVPLVSLTSNSKQREVGLGISAGLSLSVKTPVRIRINSGDINGPSAGLMFTLEVINQLYNHGDLTKGYRIAGTGTMSANGVIGQIGGVEHKIVAAANAHADYFFVPMDTSPGDTNEVHAIQAAKRIHTTMKVIPVHTLKQAVAFLQHLPLKHV